MLKKLLYLYNEGYNPFPYIKGGALEETDDGGYTYDENDADDNIYLPSGRSFGSHYERVGNEFIIHDKYAGDYILIYNPETKTFDYEPEEGEDMDVLNVKHEQLPYLLYFDEDEDELTKVNKEIKELESIKDTTELQKDLEKIEQEKKTEAKKIIVNNLQKKKIEDERNLEF